MYESVHAHPVGESTVARFAATAASDGYDGVVVRNRPDTRPDTPPDVETDGPGESDETGELNEPGKSDEPGESDGTPGVYADVAEEYGVDVVEGVEVVTEDRATASGTIGSLREQVPLLLVRGHDPGFNRFVAESERVDVLARPMAGAGDVNHVLVKAAKANGVRLEFDLSRVLRADGGERVQALRGLRKLRELVEHFDAPFVVSANPHSHLEVRAPRELLAVGDAIGFDREQIRAGLEEWGVLAARNRKRLSGEFIAPGVKRGPHEEDA